jgi:integrase
MTAEGSVYQRKSDGRWVAQYKDARGKTRYIYRKTKGEAKQALRKALSDRDAGIVPPSKMNVSNLLDEWLEDRKEIVSPRTWRNQESILRCRVKPHIGSQKLSKLSGKDVQQLYRRMLSAGLSASTVSQIHVTPKASHERRCASEAHQDQPS